MLPNCIQLSSAAALADTYLYRLYIHICSRQHHRRMEAATKPQQQAEQKKYKHEFFVPIYKTVSSPLTRFFLLLLLYVYTLEQKNLLIKAEKELCGSAGGKVFFIFFSGLAWAGLANCV